MNIGGKVRRLIAGAIAEQGPVQREQWAAANDVMLALARDGYVIVHRATGHRWPFPRVREGERP